MAEVKGYKVFNPDWTCRGFKYEVGKTYEEDVTPCTCDRGFHFCERVSDCFDCYSFDSKNKFAEIIALGEIDSDGKKSCTNKIHIVREISWNEVLQIVNRGKGCTGFSNTGNYNTGSYNVGDYNTGDCNTWDCNTGNWNTGKFNIGHFNAGDANTGSYNVGRYNAGCCNTGDFNIGYCNAGNHNIGDYNTGDWNKSSLNNGCFMTIEPKIMMFNKPSSWTYRDWKKSSARSILNRMPKDVVKWVDTNDMTDEEKKEHPEHETVGGYLKIFKESECAQTWWNELLEGERDIIKKLPNFDSEIFEQCTGIKVEK